LEAHDNSGGTFHGEIKKSEKMCHLKIKCASKQK